ncbi:hypothetical protein LguiB_016768 [Lonicera macranthoides]
MLLISWATILNIFNWAFKQCLPFLSLITFNTPPCFSFAHHLLDHGHKCLLDLLSSNLSDWATWNPDGIGIAFTP